MLWLLALVLIALLSLVGYSQGVIRMACSLAGLVLGVLLASPLSQPLQPVLKLIGMKHPVWVQVVAPLVIFLLFFIVSKIAGYTWHQKVDLHHKYKVDDRVRFQWERMQHRVGACIGVLNGCVYFFLRLLPVYIAGYLTAQLPDTGNNSAGVRLLNKLRTEIRSARIDRTLAAIDPAPAGYYDAADILGSVAHNPLLVSRLSSYPVFLTLSERPEFQALAADVEVNELVHSGKLVEVIKHPKVKAVTTNATLTAEIERLMKNDLPDLREYLETGRSKKYEGEKILGRWQLEINESIVEEKQKRPEVTSSELQRIRRTLTTGMRGLTFVATTDQQAILRLPTVDAGGGSTTRILANGQWKNEGGQYTVSLSNDKGQSGSSSASIRANLLAFDWNGLPLVFLRER